MITGLNHIAIAVPNLDTAIERFKKDFALDFLGTEKVQSALTETAFFNVEHTHVELVYPLEGQGPIAKHLEKRGGGLHHLCFSTDDIQADILRLKEKGYVFLSEKPSNGAHGSQVIFIHPKSCDGILVELSQAA